MNYAELKEKLKQSISIYEDTKIANKVIKSYRSSGRSYPSILGELKHNMVEAARKFFFNLDERLSFRKDFEVDTSFRVNTSFFYSSVESELHLRIRNIRDAIVEHYSPLISTYLSIKDIIVNGDCIIVPETIKNFKKQELLQYMKPQTVKELILPKSINIIESDFFKSFSSLKKVYFNGDLCDWCNILFQNEYSTPFCKNVDFYILDKNGQFKKNNMKYSLITELHIPEGVKTISSYAFANNDKITSVKLSNTVENILSYAFYACKQIENILISNSVVNIYPYAFAYSKGLRNVVFQKDSRLFKIHEDAFYNCENLREIVIPKSVQVIGKSAFYNCSNLINVIFEQDSKLTEIKSFAFNGCKKLRNIMIPKSVVEIGRCTFYDCENLSNVFFEEDSNLESIQYNTFGHCNSLTKLMLPNGLKKIESGAFENCNYLTNLSIPNSITRMGVNIVLSRNNFKFNKYDNGRYLGNEENPYLVFIATTSKNILTCEIHPNTKVIYPRAFDDCKKLTELILPKGLRSIEDYAFVNCSKLKNLVIPNTVVNISGASFDGCLSLKYTHYNNGNYLGNEENPYLVFASATSNDISSCEIHSNTRIIYYAAFENCWEIKHINIPSNVKNIGIQAFCNCSSLTSMIIPKTVNDMSSFLFQGCSNLQSLKIECEIKKLKSWTLDGCYNLTKLSLPNTIEEIDFSGFPKYYYKGKCCDGVDCNIYKTGRYLGNEANPYLILVGVTSEEITSFEVHPNTKIIFDDPFVRCEKLKSVTLYNNIAMIGSSAVYGYKIEDIYYKGTREQWNEIEFEDYSMRKYLHSIITYI